MDFLRSIFATPLLLSALLVIASATDYYGYGPAPKLENPEPETDNYKPTPTKSDYKLPKPDTDNYKPQPTKPDFEVPKPETDSYKPQPTKPDYYVPKPEKDNYKPEPTKPEYEVPIPEKDNYKPKPTKPEYEVPKPKGNEYEQLLPTSIAVQGVVLCKSGSKYTPIQGAVARVTCGCVDELGYETVPISVLSHVTDNKGYFFATLSLAKLGSKLKVTECKTYLESSPLENCKIPTDVNYGISGAHLSSYRLLDNKTKLYTVGPFFCTSEPNTVPNGY
ncbi:hypothetical protein RJT34_22794 [Clitoria ternatea]|uniref:Uncharacterized protein n=1 Tax=Clitoria ternatea TaxID=43366 RepID=A0AAN9IFW6_CLITE